MKSRIFTVLQIGVSLLENLQLLDNFACLFYLPMKSICFSFDLLNLCITVSLYFFSDVSILQYRVFQYQDSAFRFFERPLSRSHLLSGVVSMRSFNHKGYYFSNIFLLLMTSRSLSSSLVLFSWTSNFACIWSIWVCLILG